MRLTALIASLYLTCGCANQTIEEGIPHKAGVLGDKDCPPYAPKHSIALSRDLETRLSVRRH